MINLKLYIKKLLWPGLNWVGRDKSKLVNLMLKSEDHNELHTLDIGCGNGFFTTKAAQRGSNCLGITIHEWEKIKCDEMRHFISISDKQLQFKVIKLNELAKLKNYNNYFDQILMLDMLEHVIDDVGSLQNAHSLLSNNGLIFVSVPNRNFEFNSTAVHVSRFENGWHVRHGYTFEQIEKKLELVGFEPIDRRSYGSLGTSVIGWLQVNIFKMNNKLMLTFFPLYLLIDYLLGFYKIPHTILVIARKK